MESNFLVQKTKPCMVKPWQPTPSHSLSLSTLDNDLNLEFISQTFYVFCSKDDDPIESGNLTSHKDHRELNPSIVIQEALAKALFYYYPLAGRIKRHGDGKLRLNCTSEGVPFIVAKANCTLCSLGYLDLGEVATNKLVVPELEIHYGETDGLGYHPLTIQVTQFSCGGFTLGMGLSHAVCDGFGAIQFVRALSELGNGKSEPLVKPVWERERLIGCVLEDFVLPPMDRTSLATCPIALNSDLVHGSFNIGIDSIKKLKMDLMSEASSDEFSEGFTTLEVLGAYVWRAKFKALDMNLDGNTSFSMAVGFRNLLDPPLPEGFYGNAFVASNATIDARDLVQGPLLYVVKHIKASKKIASTQEYIKSWLALVEKANQTNRTKIEATGATTVISDWRQMDLLKLEFVGKKAVNVMPVLTESLVSADILIFMTPSSLDPSTKGGVRVLSVLPRGAMDKFKKELESLMHNQGKNLSS